MTCFSYKNGEFHAEDVSLDKIANEIDTPFYCYSSQKLIDNFVEFEAALKEFNPTICYAIKACANQAVIRTLADCGAGADIVSIGDLVRALQAEVPPNKIVFSGVGKTDEEIIAALIAGIHQFNVESIPELRRISQIASSRNLVAPVALRVNPDVKAGGYDKISTGHKATKFGIVAEQLDEAIKLATTLPGLNFKGFSVHIGSYINNYEPFKKAFSRLAEMVREWRAKGVEIEGLDLGGGFAIAYDNDEETIPFSHFANVVRETLGDLGCKLAFEPGRRLVATAGVIISRVAYVKDTPTKRFVIIDAGMNDLARPAMYGARHSVIPVKQDNNSKTVPATVVGPICESSDSFGDDFALPENIKAGDLVAILQAGAYGSSMASTYNARALIPEVMVSGPRSELVRRRISVAEQISWESLPSWV